MVAKRKMSVTIDVDILKRIEDIAEASGTAKSRVTQEALALWLKKRTQDLMAEGYAEMAEEDQKLAELAFEAQKELLP